MKYFFISILFIIIKIKYMQNSQEQPQINIPMDKTTPMVCESCGSSVFQEGYLIRKASKFLTGSPQDSIIPIGTLFCVKCGHVNVDLLPPGL